MRLVISPAAPNTYLHADKLKHNSNAFSNRFEDLIDTKFGDA
jgi:hypothetical protein